MGSGVAAYLEDMANRDAFISEVFRLTRPPRHQLGGHAVPVQDAVELEVARARLGVKAPYDGPAWSALLDEGQRWRLLAQIDFDRAADMWWGDVGTLYWLIRPEDLASGDLRAASFTWQCG